MVEQRTGSPPTAQQELHSAALRPVVDAGRRFWLLFIGLGLVALAGAGAYGLQLVAGGLSVTGYNDQVFWGSYEATLVAFIGFSYGGALVSAVLRLTNAPWRGPITRIAEVSALATLLVGALFPIIHLGHPERIWLLFVQPNFQSPIFWDMVAILTYMLATLVLLTLPLIPDAAALRDHPRLGRWHRRLYGVLSLGWTGTEQQRRSLERALTVVAILIVPLAVVVHTVLSYTFSLTSRPGWHSTIFGPYFVIGAVYSGVAVVILAALAYRRAYGLQRWIDDKTIKKLAFVMVALGAAYGYATFSEITTEGFVGKEAEVELLYGLLLERFAPLFWSFIGLGLLAPIALIAFRRTRTPAGIALAAGLVIVAMYLKRILIVVPPLSRPVIGGDVGAYLPSPVEIAIVSGAAAGVVLIMLFLFRFLPVMAVDEMVEIEREQAEALASRGRTPAPQPISVSGAPDG
ncbi:MAG: NrfD/PsrC family molybdoenzyme membrane anchor subunit [Chloroflexota bacterium]